MQSLTTPLGEGNNKWAKITKLDLIIFTANAELAAPLGEGNNKWARKLCKRVGENLFSHAMSVAKLRWKQISSLLEYFSLRQREISVVCDDGSFSSLKECGLPPQKELAAPLGEGNNKCKTYNAW